MNDTSTAGGGMGAAIGAVIGIVAYLLYAIALWRIFTKAGFPGWLGLIPIVNAIYFIKVGNKSGWLVLLYLIPIVNLVVHYLVGLWVARSFGHGHGYAIGLFFLPLVFALVLAFDGSRHRSGGGYAESFGGQVATA